jgi:hypothetical protein
VYLVRPKFLDADISVLSEALADMHAAKASQPWQLSGGELRT